VRIVNVNPMIPIVEFGELCSERKGRGWRRRSFEGAKNRGTVGPFCSFDMKFLGTSSDNDEFASAF